jgi:acyl-CoA thioester hydrolase
VDARKRVDRWTKGDGTADYPIHVAMQPRFGDVDLHLHLNNVAQARFYEEGVARFHRTELDGFWNDGAAVVGEIRIRYLAEGKYPGPLILYGGICRIGNSSYAIEQALWQEGRQLSVCQTTNVYRRRSASARIPDALRARLDEFFLRNLIKRI